MKNDEKKIIIDFAFKLNEEIKKVAKLKEHSNLEKLFDSIMILDSKDKIYEEIINYYLNILQDFRIYKMNDFTSEIEFISCLFDYAYYTYGDDSVKRRCYTIQENAEYIVTDLIGKCCNYNDRSFKLPLSLDIVKKYSINYEVKLAEMEKTIWWIILRLAVSLYILTNK